MFKGLVFALVLAVAAADSADLVTWPPGVYIGEPYSFNFYAGYIGVGASRFFYFFAESSRSPKTDVLQIFLNGGPGCSSVAGSLSENGPFYVVNKTHITNRETSWNELANVLWIESPAGVGMSYTPGTPLNATYATDDHETARNNLLAVLGWYKKFPQFRQHPLIVSGESYAGTYIPTLTLEILSYNARSPSQPISLKGLMIGNPCTAEIIDHNAVFPFLASHDVIPQSLKQAIDATCPPSYTYIVDNSCCQFNYSSYPQQSAECVANLQQMYTLFQGNNLYDLYSDCDGSDSGNAPCIGGGGMGTFLDNPLVRQAIHAAPLSVTGPWQDCTNFLNYTSNYASMATEVYPRIFQMAPHLDIMIFSGDADVCVPFIGTATWTAQIGGAVTDAWRQWDVDGQVAGYTVGFEKLRFTSIKGCGHMAATFKPKASFVMVQNYLAGSFPHVPPIKRFNRKPRA